MPNPNLTQKTQHIDAAFCSLQVLHVEQEIVGDDRSVLRAVLDCDSERSALLKVRHRKGKKTEGFPSLSKS